MPIRHDMTVPEADVPKVPEGIRAQDLGVGFRVEGLP